MFQIDRQVSVIIGQAGNLCFRGLFLRDALLYYSMIRSLYLLFLIAICLPLSVRSREVPARARRAYEAAQRRMARHEWDRAERDILEAIRIYRPYTEAYIMYGSWLIERRQYAAAARILQDGEKVCTDGQKIFAKPIASSLLGSGNVVAAINRIPAGTTDTFWTRLSAQAQFIQRASLAPDTGKVGYVGQPWGINTRDPELFPTISADGQTLYFTRRVKGIDEDFFYAKPDSCDVWQSGRNMGAPPNTLQQEAAQFISADGHYLFFMRCDNRTISGWDQGGCDLYMAYRADSIWSTPQSFGGTINTPGYEGMPCLSSDNRELYFVSNREGGFGGLDLWSSRFEHGLWQPPRNLGAEINTAGDETAPFIYADNSTLYFASNGWPGMGGSDFYTSRRANDTTWGPAVNLGMPLNTPYDEASLSLNAAGDTAYFSSDRDSVGGNFDIYLYPLPQAFRPAQVAYVAGMVYDSIARMSLNYANIYITDAATGKELYQVKSNRGDGSYTIALPTDRDYHFFVDRIAYQDAYDTIRCNKADAGIELRRNYALLPADYQAPVTDSLISTIFFARNSTVLSDTDRIRLEERIAPWRERPGIHIMVNGYTDNTGTPMLNEQLSYTRAKQVATAFGSEVFAPDVVQVQGWGEASPLAENDTEEHRDMNRRVEIVVRY